MKLVIAEKPSVAMSLAAVLGATERKDGYLEGSGYLVSWCVGHLLELAQPEAYKEQYAKWRYEDLPILPENWKYEVPKDKKKQLALLCRLMKDKRVDSVVCATDAGREGELIFRLVYEYAGCNKPMERLWISSMEDAAIREGFDHLRPGSDYDKLYDAAVCRAGADWLIGINATRLFSVLYGVTLNVGRVMSPTLALLVQRESDIESFISRPFYVPEITCGGFTASGEKMTERSEAEKIRMDCDHNSAFVRSAEKQVKTIQPPRLYDLTTLQRECNRIYGYTAQQTLDYVQSLYEKKLATYANLTGRNQGADDVIAYHLRQAFKPGEVTPEEANQIGRELALKLTKGNHAFVVCTHVDKHHVHNHIIINSTTLDCQKKFRNFWGSTWAIRRMNDKLCLEHGLSIVENPKPSREHYGTWLGNKKQPSFQEQIRIAIDAALEEKPKDFEELLQKLETAGLEVNRERKHLRFRVPGQENYTRCDTLKGDYTEQAIKERIAGTRTVKPRHAFSKKTVSKVGLLVDIEVAIRSGKGPGYERWAKVFNLKQLSQAVLYLKEHGDMGPTEEIVSSLADIFNGMVYDSTFLLIIMSAILALILGQEFSKRTINLEVSAGHSRKQIFTSKIISYLIAFNLMALVYPVSGCIREFGRFGVADVGMFFYNIIKAIIYSCLLNSAIFLIAILICCYLQDAVKATSVTAIIIFGLSLYLGYGMMLRLPVGFLPTYQIRIVVSMKTFFQPIAILVGCIWSGILVLLSWIKFCKCDFK